MDKITARELFGNMRPGFFEQEYIKNIGDKSVSEEMVLSLPDYVSAAPVPVKLADVTFGRYEGDMEAMRAAVRSVEPGWEKYYDDKHEIYCAMHEGKIVSFCLIEDMGAHMAGGKLLKVGGPGCVGTVPEFRKLGTGLRMIQLVTDILKERGYDISYIHYTGVAPWYAKLGYETVIRWNGFGIID